jgi:dTMP kinase
VTPQHPWISRLAGKFLVFDGPDGSGKTTQFRLLKLLCQDNGLTVCDVREPGGTDVGERIRAILLDRDAPGMSARCEMLLYMASRAQLVEQKIAPALARQELVLADRFVSSTIAYQGAGGGVPAEDIMAVAKAAYGDLRPDLVLIFDVDEQTAARRAGIETAGTARKGGAESSSLFADRMEARGREFRAKVRKSYLEQAAADPDRFALINASGSAEAVFESLVEALRRHFGEQAHAGP